jgi:hypothetical protein
MTDAELTDKERAQLGPRTLKETGSPEWCWQTVAYLKESLRHVDEQWRQAEQVLDDLKGARAWEKIPPDQPYGSLDALMKAEVGVPARSVAARIRDARERYGSIQTPTAPVGRPHNDSATIIMPERGATTDNLVARLKRDDPGLAERVIRGEITPHAAARAKGWRHPRIIISTPERTAANLRKHLTVEQCAELAWLLTHETSDR